MTFQWNAANLRPDPATSGREAAAGGGEAAGGTAGAREPGENEPGRPQGADTDHTDTLQANTHTKNDKIHIHVLALESVSSLTGCLLPGPGEEEGGAAASAWGGHAN